MRSVQLLDCTLRDGGYVNDWNFGNGNIACIYNRLCEAKVDIIEVGFLDDRHTYDPDRTIQPDTASMSKIFSKFDGKGPIIVAMIDYGTCCIENIQPKEDTFIDGIRIIFKKAKSDGAIAFAKQIIEKGYNVLMQMVSITSYSDRDILDFVDKVNAIRPYAVSIVDTYGLLDKKELLHYFDILDRNLDSEIRIGYHSHNNFQLAYSNSIELLEYISNRNILIDGTLYGMGKSAGNAPLELLAMHLNQRYGREFHLSSILEAIDNNIMPIYHTKPWGYTYVYYIAALNDCHPNYVINLLEKKTLSISSVNEILSSIPDESKLLYDANLLESIYRKYQGVQIDDSNTVAELKYLLHDKNIFLLGPGNTINNERDRIENAMSKNEYVVISINSISEGFPVDYVFLTNSKRYAMNFNQLKSYSKRMIATSNINPLGAEFKFVLNSDNLKEGLEKEVCDNSLLLMLNLLSNVGIHEVKLAGFDGFSRNPYTDYYDMRLVLGNRGNVEEFNKRISSALILFKNHMDIEFITTTQYNINDYSEQ